MMNKLSTSGKRTAYPREIVFHILAWISIYTIPIIFMNRNEVFNLNMYLRGSFLPFSLMIIFYLDYLYLIPQFYLKNKKHNFFLLNILAIIIISILMQIVLNKFFIPDNIQGEIMRAKEHIHIRKPNKILPRSVFIIRDTLFLFISAGIAMTIKLSLKWEKADKALKEAELKRTEAELKSLRSQINPHFLLNTLNNIYALTAFDTEKAQYAIEELSQLLRHLLYENQENFISIVKERDFLITYIELMKIRLTKNVNIEVNFNIPETTTRTIAPMILISLVENAFKHGVSPTKASFINLKLYLNEKNDIVFYAENSYFPKNATDKSGSGIGLKQVANRLELIYKNKHSWNKGVSADSSTYISELIINQ